MDPMLGEIKLFAGNFAPRDWKFCNGELLSIAQNQALFSILNNTYGGDGRTTFALPDLRGRTPLQQGSGPGLSNIQLGEKEGLETIQLNERHLPMHTHTAEFTGTGGGDATEITATATVNAFNGVGNLEKSDDAFWATGVAISGKDKYPIDGSYSATSDKVMNENAINIDVQGGGGGITDGTVAIGITGQGQAFTNRAPYIGINYIIAVQGIYPPRN